MEIYRAQKEEKSFFMTEEDEKNIFRGGKVQKFFVGIFLLALLSDLFMFRLDLTIISFFQSSSYISSRFLPILVTILSIFFAVYLLIVQLFRGRYPLDFVNKFFNFSFTGDFILNVIFAGILMILNYEFTLAKFIYLAHFVYVFSLFIKSYQLYQVFDPAGKIDDYEKFIKREIENERPDDKKINKYLEELMNYTEDSLIKNEIFIARHILDIYVNLIIHFMQNENSLIINNDDDELSISEINKKLFQAIIKVLEYSINFKQKNYREEIFRSIRVILEKCVDCDELGNFNIYSDELEYFFKHSASQNKNLVAREVIKTYGHIIDYILQEGKMAEWLNKLKKKINWFAFSTSEIYTHDELLKEMYRQYYLFLDLIVEVNDEELYIELSENISEFVERTLPNINNNTIKYLKIFNMLHTKQLIKEKQYNLVKQHLDFLKKLGEIGFINNNDSVYRYILSGFDYIIDNCDKQVIINMVNKYKYDFVLRAIEMNDGTATVFIPNYKLMLEKNGLKNKSTVSRVKEGFEKLLHRTLITKNRVVTLYLFERFNEVIMLYEKSDKREQEEYIKLYEQLLYFGVFNKEPETFHLILKQFQNLFLEMDKEDKLSYDLCLSFISIYKKLSIAAIHEKLVEFTISINRNLNEMKDESKLILKKTDLLLEIIKALFQIGMRGVENGVDDIIRNVSNKLGWIGKEAIDNNTNAILCDILSKAVKLINLCHEFKINDRTIIFNGTLFIILGGFATYKNNFGASKKIRDSVENINCVAKLYSSKLIRGYESEHWDELMGGDAAKYMEEFYRKVKIKSAS